jgi:hypothetical protein
VVWQDMPRLTTAVLCPTNDMPAMTPFASHA